jgi:hypothetical protein
MCDAEADRHYLYRNDADLIIRTAIFEAGGRIEVGQEIGVS